MNTKKPGTAVFEQRATVETWDRDYYNSISERYYDSAVTRMLEFMEMEPGATVLDAGCGPGVHSVRVAKAGYGVCAVDISQTMLQEARSRLSAAGLASKVEFQQEDLTKLSFPDASFRYIFSWGVIIHIHDVEKALEELVRVLEPGGKLALYVTNRNSLDQKLESLLRFLLRKPLAGQESLRLGYRVRYELHGQELWLWQFDITELQRQLENRGLVPIRRVIGEFSEIQRRVRGPMRNFLLRLNNLFHRLDLPPTAAVANLLIFQKADRA